MGKTQVRTCVREVEKETNAALGNAPTPSLLGVGPVPQVEQEVDPTVDFPTTNTEQLCQFLQRSIECYTSAVFPERLVITVFTNNIVFRAERYFLFFLALLVARVSRPVNKFGCQGLNGMTVSDAA